LPFLKSHLVPFHLAFACTVLLSNFVFLTFFSFGGIFGKFWFCAFLFVFLYFANFWIFSIFENLSFWLFLVLS